jgi:hypothetical protein
MKAYSVPQLPLPFAALAPFSDMDTSLAAARAIVPDLQRLERVVLEAIMHINYVRNDGGACDHEIEFLTGLKHQTASARRRALVLRGLVEDSGLRRLTDSGRGAIAWRVRYTP